jgi:hypothetical protein
VQDEVVDFGRRIIERNIVFAMRHQHPTFYKNETAIVDQVARANTVAFRLGDNLVGNDDFEDRATKKRKTVVD